MKHTPGKWEFDGPHTVAGAPNSRCFSIHRNGVSVAAVIFNPVDGDDVEQCRQDARLIAAAPELLEALQELLSSNMEFHSLFPDKSQPSTAPIDAIAANVSREIAAEEKARAAISKAEGKL